MASWFQLRVVTRGVVEPTFAAKGVWSKMWLQKSYQDLDGLSMIIPCFVKKDMGFIFDGIIMFITPFGLSIRISHVYKPWLVVWNIFYFPIYWVAIIIPIDELIFFRGVAQPPTRNGVLIPKWKIQVIGFGSGWITNNGK